MPANAPITKRDRVRKVAPKLVELSEQLLYGEIWERSVLSKRDRSLITVAALVVLNRGESLRSHLKRALDNGLSTEELGEAVTHLAFYAGWPAATAAGAMVQQVIEERG